MAIFHLYKLIIKPASEKSLFVDDNMKIDASKGLEFLYQHLQMDNLHFFYNKRPDNIEHISHDILAAHDNVVILMLQNKKKLRYLNGREEQNLEYNPGCYVIFDCRDGAAQLAIERNSSFNNNPEKVCQILDYTLNNVLRDVDLEIKIRPIFKEGDIWVAVDEQTKRFKDDIRRITFEFPTRKDTALDNPSLRLRDKFNIMQSFLFSLKADCGLLQIESKSNHETGLDLIRGDIAQLVQLCVRNGYQVYVQFKDYGVYRLGDKVRAICELDDIYVEQFIGTKSTLFDSNRKLLIEWLDETNQRTSNYNIDDHEESFNATEAED